MAESREWLVPCDEVGCFYIHGDLHARDRSVLSDGRCRVARRRSQSRWHENGEHTGSQLRANLRRICNRSSNRPN